MDHNLLRKENSLLNSHKFLPLFVIQFLNALNDNILKNAILVMISYQGFRFCGLSTEISLNLVALLFILPFFLFSSYSGRVGDACCKAKLIKIIKYFEVLIITVATMGFFLQDLKILVIALVAMGVHSTFFGPIKYSILPQYIKSRKILLLANGYMECGTFIAVLFGQFLGGWYMGNHQIKIIVFMLSISTLCGLFLSYKLEEIVPAGVKGRLSWNLISETVILYKKIMANKLTKNNIHAISWFWAIGVVYTTQLALFTKLYLGGDAHVFSMLLVIFSVSIGIGSVFCSKISNGIIQKKYVVIGAAGISIFTLILLLSNRIVHSETLSLKSFSHTISGATNYMLVSLVGFFAGLYSVTCYNELQAESPIELLSQIFAINNILNALYMLSISIICTILLIFINMWWLLFIVVVISNLFFVLWYWRMNFI